MAGARANMSVQVDYELYRRYKAGCERFGVPMSEPMRKAIEAAAAEMESRTTEEKAEDA